jgi:hypothetical protein
MKKIALIVALVASAASVAVAGDPPGGSVARPAGGNGQWQYNNGGRFGGKTGNVDNGPVIVDPVTHKVPASLIPSGSSGDGYALEPATVAVTLPKLVVHSTSTTTDFPFRLGQMTGFTGGKLTIPIDRNVGFGWSTVASLFYSYGGSTGTEGWGVADSDGNEVTKNQLGNANGGIESGAGFVVRGTSFGSPANDGVATARNTVDDNGSLGVPSAIVDHGLTLGSTHFFVLADASGGSLALTLPKMRLDQTQGVARRWYRVCKTDSSGNAVSFATSSGDTSENGADLTTENQCVDVVGRVGTAESGSTANGVWRFIPVGAKVGIWANGVFVSSYPTVEIAAGSGVTIATSTSAGRLVWTITSTASGGSSKFSKTWSVTPGETFKGYDSDAPAGDYVGGDSGYGIPTYWLWGSFGGGVSPDRRVQTQITGYTGGTFKADVVFSALSNGNSGNIVWGVKGFCIPPGANQDSQYGSFSSEDHGTVAVTESGSYARPFVDTITLSSFSCSEGSAAVFNFRFRDDLGTLHDPIFPLTFRVYEQ